MAEICGQAYNVFLHSFISLPVEERRKQAQILWDTLNSDVLGCEWPPSKKRKADECFSHKRYVLKQNAKTAAFLHTNWKASPSRNHPLVVVD